MAAGSGWTNPSLAKDPRSASPFPPDDDARSQAAGPGEEQAISVLLVEDNQTDAFVIQEVLEQCGFNYQLCIAEDGQDALQCLQEFASRSACPKLILLDLNLPKLNGIEVLRQLRKQSLCNGSRVVVVTSSDSAADREIVRGLGAEAYFRKPLDLSEYMKLTQVIRGVLGW